MTAINAKIEIPKDKYDIFRVVLCRGSFDCNSLRVHSFNVVSRSFSLISDSKYLSTPPNVKTFLPKAVNQILSPSDPMV